LIGGLSISVVIPTFNRAHLVGRALASVLREVGESDEVIVIDDGSTDNTQGIIEGFADTRVRYIRQNNSGAGVARNHGVRECRGELIAFLDSDDEWLPGRVAVQRRFMDARPDVLFSFTDMAPGGDAALKPWILRSWQSDANGWPEAMGAPIKYSSIADLPPGISDFDVYVADIYLAEMKASYLFVQCMMVRRQEAGTALRFAEGVATWEDWECFGRLARRGLMAHLTYIGAVQHKHSGRRLTQADWVQRAESRLVVLRNVWGCDPKFLGEYGDEYRALVREQKILKVRGLIVLGRTREARGEIRKLAALPLKYRIASLLPGRLMLSLVSARRAVRTPVLAGRLKTEERA
jgi:glycosyltransferase involved in cell wall biosynthesis